MRATGRQGGPKKRLILTHQEIPTKDAPDEELVRSADRHPDPDRREPGGVRLAPPNPVKSACRVMNNDPDEQLLARSIIDVHGGEAATIVRGNARGAALARQLTQAKTWIRVLGIIQRQQAAPNYRVTGRTTVEGH